MHPKVAQRAVGRIGSLEGMLLGFEKISGGELSLWGLVQEVAAGNREAPDEEHEGDK
jgi:hypothetical protein